MAPWIIAAASLISNRQQQVAESNQLKQRIMEQYAQSLGAPMYGVEVERYKADQENRNRMGSLLPLIQALTSGGGDSGDIRAPRSGAVLNRNQF